MGEKHMALWSGRFEQGVDEFTQRFGASLEVDKKMYRQDIAGSIAHAKMLAKQGVLSEEDVRKIEAGLRAIKEKIESGSFEWDVNDEDIHMAVEGALTADIGDAGARLHTGRIVVFDRGIGCCCDLLRCVCVGAHHRHQSRDEHKRQE